ncbi:iron-hydroxamate ABC transporter substrate-binding protein [Paenibacillus protaetiae]|uniref:Iron-hydroxamate ABC transporter substrate-binding protein n=1 Tax=Paenibacillus protaetiae TaxID=2509456 RepID=A0A4V0YFH0_9BACL|nr:iron-hydroxamate ABC transporter substrate-binding protein [Paenibacillus protaetiae]QAY67681.1 iron-hydroxamate ABC transporter substrate-binding protein [Paenibacillus protaetiae]
MLQKRFTIIGVILVMMLVLAACGGNGNHPDSSGTAASPSPEAPAASPSASPEASASADADTLTVHTDKGDVVIPAHPKRVAAAYYHGTLLALGIHPVGANKEWWMGSPFLKEQEADIADIGAPVDVEKVTALDPDLIVINDFALENYDQLSKIAPTVYIPYGSTKNVKEEVKQFGDLFGKQAEADQWLADYEHKAQEGRDKIKDVVKPGSTAVILNVRGKVLSVLGNNYGRGGFPIYDALQFKATAPVQEVIDSKEQIKEISLEALPQYADADYIFLCINDDPDQSMASELRKSKIWSNLPAVKNNHVYELDYKTYLYYDPVSISGQIGTIADLVAKGGQ